MRKNQKQKIMAILALCVSVVGLAIGFAAFSNTLTISSSATVTPDKLDFNINVYGIGNSNLSYNEMDFLDLSLYTSDSASEPIFDDTPQATATPAKISDNGESISISNISANMLNDEESVFYFFAIKNEGQYDAYIDTTEFDNYVENAGTCTPGEGATPELVSGACEYVTTVFVLIYNGEEIVETGGAPFKLPKGEHAIIYYEIDHYNHHGIKADGPFTVDFPNIDLNFSTVAQ